MGANGSQEVATENSPAERRFTPEQANRCFRTFVYHPSGKTAFKAEKYEDIKAKAAVLGAALQERDRNVKLNGGSLFQTAWRLLWNEESTEMKIVWETRAKLKAQDHES